MAKRIFAALIIPLVLGLAASQTRAQLSPIAVDGCAKLARVIYSEVSAAAVYGPNKSGPWSINLGQGDLSVSEHTARTVSRACMHPYPDHQRAIGTWVPAIRVKLPHRSSAAQKNWLLSVQVPGCSLQQIHDSHQGLQS